MYPTVRERGASSRCRFAVGISTISTLKTIVWLIVMFMIMIIIIIFILVLMRLAATSGALTIVDGHA